MIENLFAGGDCQATYKGTGTGSCELKRMGDLKGLALVEKGFKFTSLPTEAVYIKAVKDGFIYPITDVYGFTQDTPDSEVATSEQGYMTEIREGLPQFTFTVDKGYCAHKKLYDKKNGQWDLMLMFGSGTLIATDVKESVIKGFDLQYYNVATYKLQQGTEVESTTVAVQLRDAQEFNARMVFLTWEQLGFNMNQIDGVIETRLVATPKAGSEVVVSVGNYCNTDSLVRGLEAKDNWSVDGVEPTAVSVDSLGKYTLTLAAPLVAGETTIIAVNGEDIMEKLYKGRLVAEVKA